MKFSHEPIIGLCLRVSVWAVEGCEDSAVWRCLSRAVNVRVENIMRWGGGCKSEQHLLPGLRRVLWGQQRQISHRSYLLHSSQRQFVLAADHPGKGKERIGFLFKGRGNSLCMSSVFAFFFLLRVFRERSVTKVGSKSPSKPQLLQIDIPSTVLESF